ncbi:cadherin-like protein 26 isoform X2 [Pseudophryne corroboree]|uniref:cadherin-like protein 26 isoform X2 n=1 Tax=Pseudophryne corroboree TaxID=495146 RepID=UPI0030814757
MKSLHLLLFLPFLVNTTQGESPKGVVQVRPKRNIDLADSLRPLRRSKRRWVLTTIVLEENDFPPFPKFAGNLFNDRAENYSIRYLISGPGVDEPPEIGLFHINDQTGQVYVNRPIDREKTPLFVIRFDVADRASGMIMDKSLIFNVEVNDKNDNAPQFSKSIYEVPLKETANLDNAVFHLTATDDDKEGTPNSEITYYLINQIPDIPNVKFRIDPKNGLIYAQGCLNYETSNLIRLIAGARDKGAESLASTTTINFLIEDGNNNMPVFTNDSYQLSVKEGEIKDNLLRLKVEDKDVPNTPAWRAKFKILSGNENENYNLETDPKANEGILSIIKPLDFEGDSTMTVVISVENEEPFYSCTNTKLRMDKKVAQSNVTVSISVVDSNDAPIFSPRSKIIREKEGLKVGSTLGTFTATDPDKVPNKIRYKIAEDPGGFVTVDENTGVITTIKELDRESPYVNQTLYKVTVLAIDNGEPPGTGTGTVLLYMSDINDNTPRLITPYLETCEQGNRTSFVVGAEDKDLDPYSKPFIFEVTDQSRNMKNNWQVRQNSDDSIEIAAPSLLRGNYTVPMNIYDRQGSFSQQVLNVRVCTCPDGHTCERLMPASHQMGGGAIGAIIGTVLLFLLALLLLIFLWGSGIKKHAHMLAHDEGNQTLIQYNEEGASALSQASPGTLISNGNGNLPLATKDKEAVGRSMSSTLPQAQYKSWEHEKEAVRRPVSNTMPRAQYQSWEHDGAGFAGSGTKRLVQSQAITQNSKYMKNATLKNRHENVFVEKIGEILSHRLQRLNDAEEEVTYKPQVYACEGDMEPFDSMSFSYSEGNMDFSFLDDFDPKFANLEKICQQ